ncbi:hypothetical protein PUN28_014661 [Cardiocondyla obscurior]|uniref:Peptidoglycan-recognition protein n=1 Tax=Cardiocondyla obscurior TaxID=286306 RepID=A0AAW2EZ43_9HYME
MISRIYFVVLLAVSAIFAMKAEVKCPNIIKRNQWTVVPPGEINYLIVPLLYVIIHHTVTPECTSRQGCTDMVESIRSYHMDTFGWDDVGYSFIIGGDGNVYEGCGWANEGAHTYGYNKKSVGIAFIGNYQKKNASQIMLDTAHQLIECGKAQHILQEDVRVLGGRQVIQIASPGNYLYKQIQKWPEWSANP